MPVIKVDNWIIRIKMCAEEFIKNYWQYYIELEKQFIETQRFVAFDSQNNATFSMEYIKLLQVICSEIDVVGKVIAKHANPEFVIDKNTNINKWGLEIQQAFPAIDESRIRFWGEHEILPWKNWKYVFNKKGKGKRIVLDKTVNAKSPFWWVAYNAVKHNRTSVEKGNRPNYTRANLKSVTYALGALYILEKNQLNTYELKNTTMIEDSRVFRVVK